MPRPIPPQSPGIAIVIMIIIDWHHHYCHSLIIVTMPSPPSQRFPFPCRTGRLWWRAGGGGEGGERRADVCCLILATLTILQLLALVALQLYEGAGHQAPSCWEPTYLTLKVKKLSDNQADSKSASNHFANILWLRKKPWERRKCGVDPITGDCVRWFSMAMQSIKKQLFILYLFSAKE